MSGPLIVTAQFGDEDFAWLNGLRIRHFPPERNQAPAHLTLFHSIPPSAEQELRSRLRAAASAPKPRATVDGLMDLGGGVAFRIVSDDLEAIWDELADGLHGLLSAQDSGGWRPHVTIQNKVPPKVARALLQSLHRDFERRPLTISGLALQRYVGGPWEPLGSYPFRKSS